MNVLRSMVFGMAGLAFAASASAEDTESEFCTSAQVLGFPTETLCNDKCSQVIGPEVPLLGARSQPVVRSAITRRRQGPSLRDPPPRPGTWQVYQTDDPAIWAADVCLGFFLTRDPTVFQPGSDVEFSLKRQDNDLRIWVTRQDGRARLNILDWPISKYGVFQCENAKIPQLPDLDLHALQTWVETRLPTAEGWIVENDSRSLMHGINRRNDALELTVRVARFLRDQVRVEVEADYLGPPIPTPPWPGSTIDPDSENVWECYMPTYAGWCLRCQAR